MSSHQQPVPKVTDADVTRVVQRDFLPEVVGEVLAVLARYGHEEWQPEAPRVRLAVLKLSGGRLPELNQQVESACLDYRDVLAAAEYPRYCASIASDTVDADERAAAIAADWAQYSSWLGGPAEKP